MNLLRRKALYRADVERLIEPVRAQRRADLGRQLGLPAP